MQRDASAAAIKSAYRKLAKKHHPDTHANDPKAVKKFQEISAAYEVIGDKEKRAQYDRGEIDEAGQPKGFNPGAHGFEGFRARPGGKGPGGFDFHWTGGGEHGGGAEDIFADILGGFGGRSRKPQPQKGADLQFTTTISLQEAAQGGARRVTLGGDRQLEVRIPPGVKEGQQIRLRGQGNPGDGQGGAFGVHVRGGPTPGRKVPQFPPGAGPDAPYSRPPGLRRSGDGYCSWSSWTCRRRRRS